MENLMIKHILVGASGLASDADLLAAAFNLARPFSAHVDVLHVRRDPARDLPIYGEGFPPEMLDTIIREAERNAGEASAAARRMFDQAVAAASIPVTSAARSGGRGTGQCDGGMAGDHRAAGAGSRGGSPFRRPDAVVPADRHASGPGYAGRPAVRSGPPRAPDRETTWLIWIRS